MKRFLENALSKYLTIRRRDPHISIRANIWTVGGHYFDSLEVLAFDEEGFRTVHVQTGMEYHIDFEAVIAITIRERT
jgi:hypothetical protein